MKLIGTSPRLLILGFILPTAFLSMWISNTATTAMMIPIMQAVIDELDDVLEKAELSKLKAMLAMSICMSANIGGTGTTIGTGPNLILVGNLNTIFPDHPVTFGSWMAFAVPQMLIALFVVWIWLQLYYLPLPFCGKKKANKSKLKPEDNDSDLDKDGDPIAKLIQRKYNELGSMKFREATVLTLFIILVLLWFFRYNKTSGSAMSLC